MTEQEIMIAPEMKALPKEIKRLVRSRTVNLGSYVDEKGNTHEKEAAVFDVQFDSDLADAVAKELPAGATQADMPEAIRRAVAKMKTGETHEPVLDQESAGGPPAPQDAEMYRRWVFATLRDRYGLGVKLGEFASVAEMVDVLALMGVSVSYDDWLAARYPGNAGGPPAPQ